jgi:hypothetical protein
MVTIPTSIRRDGSILGYYEGFDLQTHIFLLKNGVAQTIDLLGGTLEVLALREIRNKQHADKLQAPTKIPSGIPTALSRSCPALVENQDTHSQPKCRC